MLSADLTAYQQRLYGLSFPRDARGFLTCDHTPLSDVLQMAPVSLLLSLLLVVADGAVVGILAALRACRCLLSGRLALLLLIAGSLGYVAVECAMAQLAAMALQGVPATVAVMWLLRLWVLMLGVWLLVSAPAVAVLHNFLAAGKLPVRLCSRCCAVWAVAQADGEVWAV